MVRGMLDRGLTDYDVAALTKESRGIRGRKERCKRR